MSRHHFVFAAVVVANAFLCSRAAFAQLPAAVEDRNAMIELGKQHATAEDLYAYFKEQADGGTPLTYETLPDWSGIYSLQFTAAGLAYDSAQGPNELPPAKLVPEYYDKMVARVEARNQGI